MPQLNAFGEELRISITLDCEGLIRNAALFLLLHHPPLLKAANSYSKGSLTHEVLVCAVEEARGACYERSHLPTREVAEAIAKSSLGLTKRKMGFTLVELSIVLVIIGLLIGGILVAQSMIGTAKIQALIRQSAQFDAAALNFETKFGQLPGDTTLMGVAPGNGDGTITGGGVESFGWGYESGKFWSDLSTSGLQASKGGSYPDCSAGTCDLTVNAAAQAPIAVAGQRASFIVIGNNHANYYVLGNNVGSVSGMSSTPAFSPADALAVDTKIDDAIANSGNIIGSDSGGMPIFNILDSGSALSGGTTCTNTGGGPTYRIGSNNIGCIIVMRLGTAADIAK